MPFDIEFLVMVRSLERTQPGGDGIVAAWFHLHVVGWVGEYHLGHLAIHQRVNSFGIEGITAD